MTSGVERLISGAGRMNSDLRKRLKEATLSVMLKVKSVGKP